jgi:hypothetical protein
LYELSRRAPPIMSLLALAICLVGWAGIMRDPPGDEGALAHSYQLLMISQIPAMAYFLFVACRRGGQRDLPIFGLQIALWVTAVAAIPVLGL